MASNLTKYTVQEALNRENNFEVYGASYDDVINLASSTQISGVAAGESTHGNTEMFRTHQDGVADVWSKVIVESNQDLFIELGQGGEWYQTTVPYDTRRNTDFGDVIYVPAANLPITFTGYDITDLRIKMAAGGTLGIQTWR